ncbi:MAG TPA: radical SAM protein [Archangium sp.]|nr:radical SAM protein [Archangium sp.]
MSGPERRRLEWVLIFPPLVSSNWGHYYPSLACLAAVLAEGGFRAVQVDLNEQLFDYLIEPARLRSIVQGARAARLSLQEVARTAAAELLLENPEFARDSEGRHRSQDDGRGFEMVGELARALYLDADLEALADGEPEPSAVVRQYQAFFEASGVARLLEHDSVAIGISVPMGPQLCPTLLLARYLKSLRPDARIILGGPVLTLMSPQRLHALLERFPCVDAVVRYEGEGPIRALAEQLERDVWRPEEIPHVVTRESAGVTPRGAATTDAFHPARLPYARFDAALLARLRAPRIGVLQARGCYWGECSYCDFIELYSSTRRYNGRPVAGVVGEIAHLRKEHGINAFWLVTESLPPAQGDRFARLLLERGVRCDWRSFAMVDPGFTPEMLSRYVESGCTSLTIGMESMTTRVLKLVRKRATQEDNEQFLQACRKAGLKLDVNLIPNLPTTTYAEALEGLRILEGYSDTLRAVAVFPFEATASSQVGRSPEAFGLSVVGTGRDPGSHFPSGQAQFLSNRLVCSDPGMSEHELQEVFARYEAFARALKVKKEETLAPPAQGLHLRSSRVALVRDAAQAYAYDWDKDRVFRIPEATHEFLGWLKARQGRASRRDIANYLAPRAPPSRIPLLCAQLIDTCRQMGVLDHVAA